MSYDEVMKHVGHEVAYKPFEMCPRTFIDSGIIEGAEDGKALVRFKSSGVKCPVLPESLELEV